MKPPATIAEFRLLLDAGRLLDLAGKPLVSRTCEHCKGLTLGETCPQGVPCPSCRQRAGLACRRPSEHVLSPAFNRGQWCVARKRAAAAHDDEREAAGDPTIPRRWEDVPE